MGSTGIIAAYTRTFCGTCNRLRITPDGILKTCLYDAGVLDLKQLLRNGSGNEQIERVLMQTFQERPLDGWEAEAARKENPVHESMATIGG